MLTLKLEFTPLYNVYRVIQAYSASNSVNGITGASGIIGIIDTTVNIGVNVITVFSDNTSSTIMHGILIFNIDRISIGTTDKRTATD